MEHAWTPNWSPRAVLGLILVFGFCVRASTFQSPILDQHAWRQADTAAISRAFAEERYNILYPQVEWRGDSATGYVQTGLELHAFLVASVAKLSTFKAHTGRLLSAFYFLISCTLVWTFTRRRYGPGPGLFAAYLYAFGFPLMLYMERAFMNEALLVCLSLVSLVSVQRYLARPGDDDTGDPGGARWIPLVIACIATALLGAIKLPYLIVLGPIWGLFLERFGWRGIGRPEPWALLACAVIVTALWYSHAHSLGVQSGLSFFSASKEFDPELLGTERFYRMVSQRIFRDILGPVGLVGMIAGAWLVWRQRRWCEGLGLLGFLVYVALVTGANLAHNYYQLAMMPVAATVVAIGILDVIDRVPALRRSFATSVTAVLILVALATTIRLASFHSWFAIPADYQELCALGSRHAPSASDRIAIVGSREPQFLFCMNRKGWLIDSGPDEEAQLRLAWEHGARLAIVYPGAGERLSSFLTDHGKELELMGPIRAFGLLPR